MRRPARRNHTKPACGCGTFLALTTPLVQNPSCQSNVVTVYESNCNANVGDRVYQVGARDEKSRVARCGVGNDAGSSMFFCRGFLFRYDRAAGAACLRAADLSRGRVHLGSWLLGIWRFRLLLGAWNLGVASVRRSIVDSGLLGLE